MMFRQNRREVLVIIIVIAVVGCLGLSVAGSRDTLNIHYPEQFCVLNDEDFQLDWRNYTVQLGSTPGETVIEHYPYGYMLGISTIFSLDEDDVLFTFTEEENILQKAHIENPDLATFRGTRVGDPFASVVDQYGKQYAWVNSGSADDFDAVYGSDNSRCIVFQVRTGLVERIILQNDPLTAQ